MVVGPLIGGIASIAGAGLGAMASSHAADMNWQINLLNYYQRENERREARQQADEIRAEQKKGGVDAAGNRTYFDPVMGWVTDLSEQQQNIFDLQQNEQQQVLENDLPIRREALNRQNDRQVTEGDLADGALLRYLNQRYVTDDEVTGKLQNAAAKGNSRVYNEIAKEAASTSINRGSPYAAEMLDDIGQSAAGSLANAMAQAELQGMGSASEINSSNESGNLNLYNLLASRASAPLNTPYSPQNVTGEARAGGAQYPGLAQGGNSAAMQAVMKPGGTLDYMQPDFGAANALTSAGGSLAAMFDAAGQSRSRSDANSMLLQYLQANGGSLGTGGIYGNMGQRVRAGGSF